MRFYRFIYHNWFAIFYFNFKKLPFKQAIKLPFDFYYKIRFESLEGDVVINCDKIYQGMIKIGGRGSDMFPHIQTVLSIKGRWEIGEQVEIGHGSITIVEKNGILCYGKQVRIGAMTKVYCERSIKIKDNVGISWESQVFDTNFHYIEDMEKHVVHEKNSPVVIGSNNWFGNRVNIMKGTVIGDNIIVASNSLCNKDYSSIPSYSIIGGSPSRMIKNNIRRLFSKEEKEYINKL